MEDPQFTEVEDFTVPTDDGEAFATVSFPLPSDLRDNSGEAVTVTTSPDNNTELAIGEQTVTYTVADTNGNSVMFSIKVTVIG